MATLDCNTTHDANPAAEREARYIEIMAGGILDVLPERRDIALRALDIARERVLAAPAVRQVPDPDLFRA